MTNDNKKENHSNDLIVSENQHNENNHYQKDLSDFPNNALWVESLNLDANGVAHKSDGKVVFIDGALPFEVVSAQIHRKKSKWEQAEVQTIYQESSQRVAPKCPHFGLHNGACGGCKMQHVHPNAQVAIKQRVLEDNFKHLAKVQPQMMLRPIEGPAWAYRFRARLSVRYVLKKQAVLIGFHERKSSFIADMRECHVLPQFVSDLLLPLRDLIASMDARNTCPQIELACGDLVVALVLRHLEPLGKADLQRLRDFAQQKSQENHPIEWWLQAQNPENIELLDAAEGKSSSLSYSLPEFGVIQPFKPTDFTQVNPFINRVLVSKALKLLDIQKDERIIDWFCGLGNFTLPIATKARDVLGVEGSEMLVKRSQENFENNLKLFKDQENLKNKKEINEKEISASNKAQALYHQRLCATQFVARDLFKMTEQMLLNDGKADKWLVDPPREGAFSLVKALAQLQQNPDLKANHPNWQPPKRIVYVSCNPATLARDADVLVHLAGYRCSSAGVVNMFAHTAHVESIAVFDLQ